MLQSSFIVKFNSFVPFSSSSVNAIIWKFTLVILLLFYLSFSHLVHSLSLVHRTFFFPLLLFLSHLLFFTDSSITDSSSHPKNFSLFFVAKVLVLSSTGKEALNQTHPRSKSISFSPSSQPPSKIKNQNQPIFVPTHPRSRIKINPSSF